MNLDAANEAQKTTGVKIDSVIDSVHWTATDCLTQPDETDRAKGLAALKGAIAAAEKVGADTVLLVPGVVRDGRSRGAVRRTVGGRSEKGYDGWTKAEVGSVGEKFLLDASARMDKVLGLK